MTGTYDPGYEFEKEVEIEIEFDLESDVDIELEKDVDVEICVDSDVNLDGNFASATFSAEAIGDETYAQADVHVLVIEGHLSSVDGVLIAATDDGGWLG